VLKVTVSVSTSRTADMDRMLEEIEAGYPERDG
jgi:hypothetical protein